MSDIRRKKWSGRDEPDYHVLKMTPGFDVGRISGDLTTATLSVTERSTLFNGLSSAKVLRLLMLRQGTINMLARHGL
jgi:hypothetical protein